MVLQALRQQCADISFEIIAVKTHGDRVSDKPIAALGGRGVFVKELQEALLSGEVDLVVHSLKDLPTDTTEGLALAAVTGREDPRDVLVSGNNVPFAKLPAGASVATSSRRRVAQLLSARGDLNFVDIRGNITTRLRKHDEGQCDAMVLAAAGLTRLGMADRIAEFFDPEKVTPAAGQGVLAVECRSLDAKIRSLLERIDDPVVRAQITAERTFLDALGGGCSVPIGAHAAMCTQSSIRLIGCIAAIDGSQVFRSSLVSTLDDAARLGLHLAEQMLSGPAKPVLDSLKMTQSQAISPP